MLHAIRKPAFQARFLYEITCCLKKHMVIPDVIDAAPPEVAKVTYPSGAKVNMGNELTPTQVKDIPTVKWNANNDTYYTLCMTDPDAPSRDNPKFREWHHWLVGNIPGHRIDDGETLSAYIGSGPPEGTGLHRYIILIFEQQEELCFHEKRLPNTSGKHRERFKIRKFSCKYNLGNPVAGNFYLAQWDDYVPKLYKQLGG